VKVVLRGQCCSGMIEIYSACCRYFSSESIDQLIIADWPPMSNVVNSYQGTFELWILLLLDGIDRCVVPG
jgi:hypothetical protein